MRSRYISAKCLAMLLGASTASENYKIHSCNDGNKEWPCKNIPYGAYIMGLIWHNMGDIIVAENCV